MGRNRNTRRIMVGGIGMGLGSGGGRGKGLQVERTYWHLGEEELQF